MKLLTKSIILNLFLITAAMAAHADVKNYNCANGAQLSVQYLASPAGEISYANQITVSNSAWNGVYTPMGD